MSSQRAPSCVLVQKQARHVVEDGDCNRGCRDLSQNPRVSWALDMSRIAFARPQYEGNRLGAWVLGTGRM